MTLHAEMLQKYLGFACLMLGEKNHKPSPKWWCNMLIYHGTKVKKIHLQQKQIQEFRISIYRFENKNTEMKCHRIFIKVDPSFFFQKKHAKFSDFTPFASMQKSGSWPGWYVGSPFACSLLISITLKRGCSL